ERGFELDLDRLLALVRIYDQLGTPDALEAAAMICRYILRDLEARGVEKISLVSRLASLERRAGRADVAAELDRAFLSGVRRRIPRPSLHELVRVAPRDSLPLDRLRAVKPAGDALPADVSRRELALVHALRDDRARARELFASGDHALDRRYLADL